jgi:hypothetical protein
MNSWLTKMGIEDGGKNFRLAVSSHAALVYVDSPFSRRSRMQRSS